MVAHSKAIAFVSHVPTIEKFLTSQKGRKQWLTGLFVPVGGGPGGLPDGGGPGGLAPEGGGPMPEGGPPDGWVSSRRSMAAASLLFMLTAEERVRGRRRRGRRVGRCILGRFLGGAVLLGRKGLWWINLSRKMDERYVDQEQSECRIAWKVWKLDECALKRWEKGRPFLYTFCLAA